MRPIQAVRPFKHFLPLFFVELAAVISDTGPAKTLQLQGRASIDTLLHFSKTCHPRLSRGVNMQHGPLTRASMEGMIEDFHDQRCECLMDERQRRDELVDAFWSCSSFVRIGTELIDYELLQAWWVKKLSSHFEFRCALSFCICTCQRFEEKQRSKPFSDCGVTDQPKKRFEGTAGFTGTVKVFKAFSLFFQSQASLNTKLFLA
ncbi:uncharacterized protein UDID_17767 [Ustilago sp. UG-2017a]|nr:uncharacterized protein UDID_17767 [Ustilago sp. UG-2017a]